MDEYPYRKTLLELSNESCRWPVGGPREFFFCGRPEANLALKRPYCPACASGSNRMADPNDPECPQMTPLKNSRHEAFAVALSAGSSIIDAYAKAGFKKNSGNPKRLARRQDIQARVTELQTSIAEQVIFSEVEMRTRLKEIAMVPIKREDVRPSDVLKAVELSAKMDSLLGKKKEVKTGGLIIHIYEEEVEF